MAAAVSDYVPSFEQVGKLKKESLGGNWELRLKENVDILSSIDKDGIVSVGFKARWMHKMLLEMHKICLKEKELMLFV